MIGLRLQRFARHPRLKFLGIFIACTMMAVLQTQSAQAQSVTIDPQRETKPDESLLTLDVGLASEGVYTTNIFQSTFNPQDDFYIMLQPIIAAQVNYRMVSAQIAYKPRFYLFTSNFSNSDLSNIAQNLNLAVTLLDTTYFKIRARDSLDTTQTLYSNPLTPNNLSLRNQVQVDGLFNYEFGPRTYTELLVFYRRTDIEFPGQDLYTVGGSGAVTHELWPFLSLLAKGNIERNQYDNFVQGNGYTLGAQGGVLFQIQERLRGQALVKYDRIQIFGPLDNDNIGFILGLDYELYEKTNLKLDLRQELGQDLTGNVVKHTVLTGGIRQGIGQRTSIFGKGHYGVIDIPSFSPVEDRIWGASGGVNYDINEKLNIGVRYEYDTNIGPNFFADFEEHRGIVSLSYYHSGIYEF